jgi:hypothetical protein
MSCTDHSLLLKILRNVLLAEMIAVTIFVHDSSVGNHVTRAIVKAIPDLR